MIQVCINKETPMPLTTLLRFAIVLLAVVPFLFVNQALSALRLDDQAIALAVQATLTAMPRAVQPPTNKPSGKAPASSAQNQPDAMAIRPTAPAAHATAEQTPAIAPSNESTTMEQTVIQLINERRRLHGLTTLVLADQLTLAARRHSLDMARHNLTQHTGSDGSNGGQRISDAGYRWTQWDETIAWGDLDAASVVDWFFNSETHRAVLLSPELTDIGVGVVSVRNSQWRNYWTVNIASKPAVWAAPASTPQPLTTSAPSEALINNQEPQNVASEPGQSICPTSSDNRYETIPMEGADYSHPDYLHADLNFGQRGLIATAGETGFIDYAGPTDADAPQLAGIFANSALRPFGTLYQTYDWDWGCGPDGCRGAVLTQPAVSLLGLPTTPGEAVFAPSRQAEIYGGGYLAVVLYAEPTRITLAYTRDGTVAHGYAVHLEQLCVDPNLLTAYRTANHAGRSHLPALRVAQALGTATGAELIVAVRDRGAFLDPRSRKDWWHTAYATAMTNDLPQQ
jgi:uncharacterized protein YkwD